MSLSCPNCACSVQAAYFSLSLRLERQSRFAHLPSLLDEVPAASPVDTSEIRSDCSVHSVQGKCLQTCVQYLAFVAIALYCFSRGTAFVHLAITTACIILQMQI